MATERCVCCDRNAPVPLGIHLTGEGDAGQWKRGFHCGRCAAEVLAKLTGRDLHYVELEPIAIKSAAGRSCVFHFKFLTTGPEPVLRALEIQDGNRHGYETAVIMRAGESSVALIARLLAKLRNLLSRTDVVDNPALSVGLAMTSSEIRGVMEYDVERDGPCVVVDGRKIDWETFGHLLLSHEGFQFRLEFHDPTDDI